MALKSDVWLDLVDRFKRSGLSLEAFADREQISASRLSWWCSHREHMANMQAPLQMVRLEAASNASEIEVVLRGGHRIVVPMDFDEQHLRRVIAVVDGVSQ